MPRGVWVFRQTYMMQLFCARQVKMPGSQASCTMQLEARILHNFTYLPSHWQVPVTTKREYTSSDYTNNRQCRTELHRAIANP